MLKYPNMRAELVGYVEDLADKDGRQATWATNGNDFDEIVHFIYDDTPLADDARRALGFFLLDEDEVAGVQAVVEAIENLFERHGTAEGNTQVGAGPEWEVVKTRATELLALLLRVPAEPEKPKLG